MAQKKPHVAMILFRRKFCDPQVDGNDYCEIEVLLSQRAAFQYEEESPKPQSFFRGMQIFPGGKMEDGDRDSWHCAMRELREEGGDLAYSWVKALLEMDHSRLRSVDEYCYAIELAQDESEKFVSLIKLAPEHTSIGWYSHLEVSKFKDLAPYKDQVPKGIKAIFADEAGWIKKLAETMANL
ncbi:MAG TPA: NUDIX hydrolase [bacterium]|nr:NUDIX hydrolase [bacterium]